MYPSSPYYAYQPPVYFCQPQPPPPTSPMVRPLHVATNSNVCPITNHPNQYAEQHPYVPAAEELLPLGPPSCVSREPPPLLEGRNPSMKEEEQQSGGCRLVRCSCSLVPCVCCGGRNGGEEEEVSGEQKVNLLWAMAVGRLERALLEVEAVVGAQGASVGGVLAVLERIGIAQQILQNTMAKLSQSNHKQTSCSVSELLDNLESIRQAHKKTMISLRPPPTASSSSQLDFRLPDLNESKDQPSQAHHALDTPSLHTAAIPLDDPPTTSPDAIVDEHNNSLAAETPPTPAAAAVSMADCSLSDKTEKGGAGLPTNEHASTPVAARDVTSIQGSQSDTTACETVTDGASGSPTQPTTSPAQGSTAQAAAPPLCPSITTVSSDKSLPPPHPTSPPTTSPPTARLPSRPSTVSSSHNSPPPDNGVKPSDSCRSSRPSTRPSPPSSPRGVARVCNADQRPAAHSYANTVRRSAHPPPTPAAAATTAAMVPLRSRRILPPAASSKPEGPTALRVSREAAPDSGAVVEPQRRCLEAAVDSPRWIYVGPRRTGGRVSCRNGGGDRTKDGAVALGNDDSRTDLRQTQRQVSPTSRGLNSGGDSTARTESPQCSIKGSSSSVANPLESSEGSKPIRDDNTVKRCRVSSSIGQPASGAATNRRSPPLLTSRTSPSPPPTSSSLPSPPAATVRSLPPPASSRQQPVTAAVKSRRSTGLARRVTEQRREIIIIRADGGEAVGNKKNGRDDEGCFTKQEQPAIAACLAAERHKLSVAEETSLRAFHCSVVQRTGDSRGVEGRATVVWLRERVTRSDGEKSEMVLKGLRKCLVEEVGQAAGEEERAACEDVASALAGRRREELWDLCVEVGVVLEKGDESASTESILNDLCKYIENGDDTDVLLLIARGDIRRLLNVVPRIMSSTNARCSAKMMRLLQAIFKKPLVLSYISTSSTSLVMLTLRLAGRAARSALGPHDHNCTDCTCPLCEPVEPLRVKPPATTPRKLSNDMKTSNSSQAREWCRVIFSFAETLLAQSSPRNLIELTLTSRLTEDLRFLLAAIASEQPGKRGAASGMSLLPQICVSFIETLLIKYRQAIDSGCSSAAASEEPLNKSSSQEEEEEQSESGASLSAVPVSMILSMKKCHLFGLVNFMTTLARSREARGAETWHASVESLLLTSCRIMNAWGRIDLESLQDILSRTDFASLVVKLLDYCVPRLSQTPEPDVHDCRLLAHEIVVLIGRFCVLDQRNQSIMSHEVDGKTILARLTSFPIGYFMNAKLKCVLFPTLLAGCFNNSGNLKLLQNEMSPVTIKNFIQKWIGSYPTSKNETNTTRLVPVTNSEKSKAEVPAALSDDPLKDGVSFLELESRFPRVFLEQACAFFFRPD
eukprot:GHVS01047626.1.p1 GENE.GHVS01047626.1~~GHVS01047626.1.p1  ORF type:complete len:1464 (-),score=277.75 GHVS01047626.1:24-4133(-)